MHLQLLNALAKLKKLTKKQKKKKKKNAKGIETFKYEEKNFVLILTVVLSW